MKSKFIFLFVLIFLSVSTFAQKKFWLQGSLEAKHSMGGDYFIPADVLDTTVSYEWQRMHTALAPKITVSAEGGYNFNARIAVSLGIAFAMRGNDFYNYTWNYSGYTVEFRRKVNLNYVEVPLEIHYTHSPGKKISLIATAGGYASLLVSYKDYNKFLLYDGSRIASIAEDKTSTLTITSGTKTQTQEASLNEEPFTTYDYGIMLGAGIRVLLSDKTQLILLPQYCLGFTDVKNKNSTATFENQTTPYWQDVPGFTPNMHEHYVNSSIGLKIGLRFAL